MTKKSDNRLRRDRQGIPNPSNIASVRINYEQQSIVFTTKDMLQKQLRRDGPKIARAFDRLTKDDISECSEVFGRVQGLLVQHLPRLDDEGFKATSSRLLFYACNTLTASIEVARHGYPSQYGALGRVFIETLATVVVLAIKGGALEEFHAGKLSSTKCVGWAKPALPPLGPYYGTLNNFVHVGKGRSVFEGPHMYTARSEALQFIRNSLRGHVWLLDVVADLIFSDEEPVQRYWLREGPQATFQPSSETKAWTNRYFASVENPVFPSA